MKSIWTEDAEIIQKEFDSLVENKTELICGRRGSENITKLPVVGKTALKNTHVFIVLHPHEPTCSSETCIFYYHSKGNPLRAFESKRVKKAENFVGYELPRQIFNIYHRKYERVTTPNNSVATFCIKHKQRIYHGTVGDVSLEGAKISAEIPGVVANGVLLCHMTLTIRYRLSEIQTVIAIPEAEIIWSKCENEVTNTVGIRFSLSESDLAALSNYIDIRAIEESSKAR